MSFSLSQTIRTGPVVSFLVYLSTTFVHAQKSVDFKNNFDQAEGFMYISAYEPALDYWRACYKIDSLNANINFKLGYTYLLLPGQKHKAAKYLEMASHQISKRYVELSHTEKYAPGYTMYYLGTAYHLNNELDKAESAYRTYIEKHAVGRDEKKEGERQINMINNARKYSKNPVALTFRNLGDSINSSFPEFSPVVSADESVLLYTSKRDNTTGEQQDEDGTYHEDICISDRVGEGWSFGRHISDHINITGNEAVVGLSADGQQLFLHRKSEKDHGDIYSSTLVGEEWSFPVRLGPEVNTEEFCESSASLSADGQTLYFVSDRKGGVGGKDIYFCKKQPDGSWSAAVNAGNTINSSHDEEAVYVHPDGKHLYFSSDNDNSMGGLDVFVSVINSDGSFGAPENRGYPINTCDDDFHYSASADARRVYVTSGIRGVNTAEKTLGDKDIYVLNLSNEPSAKLTMIKGFVYKPMEDFDLSKIKIATFDAESNSGIPSEIRVNTKSGRFTAFLPHGKNYRMAYDFEKYGKYTDTVISANAKVYREIIKDIDLAEPNPFEPRWKKVLAQNDAFDINKNSPQVLDVLKNDETTAATLVTSSLKIIKQPKNGKITQDNDGAITYTPNTNFEGRDLFAYTVSNNRKAPSNVADVSLNIRGGAISLAEGGAVASAADWTYEKYFGYRIYRVDNSKDWKGFIEEVLKQISSSGSVNLTIESSASNVPSLRISNEKLAEKRAAAAEQKLKMAIIKGKGDWAKVKITSRSVVQGPEYNGDYKDKAKYGPYQYVKIKKE